MKKIIFPFFFLVLGGSTYAQSSLDALRYSVPTHFGTSRGSALGHSLGAIGADVSAIQSNPAGIALFRKGEFSISSSLKAANQKGIHNTNEANDANVKFNVDHISYVNTKHSDLAMGKIKSTGFIIGYNRMSDFNQHATFKSEVEQSSILDVYYDDIINNSIPAEEINVTNALLETVLAWEALLIDTVVNQSNNTYSYFHYNPFREGKRTKTLEHSGSIGTYYIGYAIDLNDAVYLGGSINFLAASFNEVSKYEERTDDPNRKTKLQYLSVVQNISTSGNGVQAKLGAIFKATDQLRVGISYQTPSTVNFTENFDSRIDASIDSIGNTYAESIQYTNEYGIRIPGRLIGSLGVVLGKRGFFSCEYEYTDVSLSKLKENTKGLDFSAENNIINRFFKPMHTLKFGLEARVNAFRLRGGYVHQTTPFVDNANQNFKFNSFSSGIGYRNPKFFVDLSWRLDQRQEHTWFYDSFYVNHSTNKLANHYITTTLGFRL